MAFICSSVQLSCPRHISGTLWKSFIRLLSNDCLSETVCRPNNKSLRTEGQGHNRSSRGWADPITKACGLKVKVITEVHGVEPRISCPLHISFTPGRIFMKLYSNVRLCKNLSISHADSRSSHSLRSWESVIPDFFALSISYLPPRTFSSSFCQMFISERLCGEPKPQLSRRKVKVTIESHELEPWISCPLNISYTPGRIFIKLVKCLPH